MSECVFLYIHVVQNVLLMNPCKMHHNLKHINQEQWRNSTKMYIPFIRLHEPNKKKLITIFYILVNQVTIHIYVEIYLNFDGLFNLSWNFVKKSNSEVKFPTLSQESF